MHTFSSPSRRWTLIASLIASAGVACGDDTDETTTAPTIEAFSASPTSVTSGATATLTWATTGALQVLVYDGQGRVISDSADASGSVTTAALSADTTFKLDAINTAGTTSREVTVTVTAGGPAITRFEALPSAITAGETVTLTWQTTGVESVEISDGAASVVTMGAASGMAQVMPAVDTTYTLVGTAADGSTVMGTASVTVSAAPLAPSITSFTGPSAPIDAGASATLSWTIANAPTTVTIVDGAGTSVYSGSEAMSSTTVSPAATTTYTLTARNAQGMATAMVSVTVNQAASPQITSFTATPTSLTAGASAVLSWVTTGATRVVVSDGATTLSDSAMASGMVTVTPSQTTTYTLTASGTGNPATGMVTVMVAAVPAPSITVFTASPALVAASSTTTLSWTTMNATSVSITQGGATVTTSTLASGSYAATVPAGSQTFTLTASGTGTAATQTVTVLGVNAPTISSFAVMAYTSSAAVSWSVMDVSTLSLTADGVAVSGFTGVTTSSVTSSMGTLTVPLTASTVFELVGTNVAGTARQSVTATPVVTTPSETEPNDGFATATSVTVGSTGMGAIDGEITAGDEDWYSVTIAAGSSIRAETSDGMGSCATGMDTIIALYDTNGTSVLASNDDGGSGRCSLIDPAVYPTAAGLPAGTYYVRVYPYSTSVGTYQLSITVIAPVCGNGIVELAAGEVCDDSNSSSGDGCSSTCGFEAEYSYTGPAAASVIRANVNPATDLEVVQVTASAESYLAVETLTSTAGTCASDTFLTLYSSTGTTTIGVDDADGVSSCSAIRPSVDSWARLPAGNYWLVAEEDGQNATISNLVMNVQLLPVNQCGNGVAETGEGCDDGNTTNGDGCSATCAIEVAGSYTVVSATATVATSIATVGQTANITINVTTPGYLTARTQTDLSGACASDTQMNLNDSTGTSIAYNDDGGTGLCSAFTSPLLSTGTYELVVNEYGNNGTIANLYVVLGSIQANICGNGIAETGETCDDGNTVSGDGCSSMCALEGNNVTETEPNDTIATAQALSLTTGAANAITVSASFTANDTDYFAVTVPMGATWTVQADTHGQAANLSSCSTDTILYLDDASGTLITSGDDTGYGLCSSISASLTGGTAAGGTTYYISAVQYSGATASSYYLTVSAQ